MNSVAGGVLVGPGTGVGELNRQRRITLAKPRQYRQDAISMASAIKMYSTFVRRSRCS